LLHRYDLESDSPYGSQSGAGYFYWIPTLHGDFAKIDGRFAWEILFSQTLPEVSMQMDAGNCLDGNGDPIAMLKKFPGRTPTIHIKEHQEKSFESDFYKEVFRLCERGERSAKGNRAALA
jgi:hypothetical protein